MRIPGNVTCSVCFRETNNSFSGAFVGYRNLVQYRARGRPVVMNLVFRDNKLKVSCRIVFSKCHRLLQLIHEVAGNRASLSPQLPA